MCQDASGKKQLLLIAPVFFGYYKEIIREAELLGYNVDYLCDAPSNSNLSKAIARVNKKLVAQQTRKYFNDKVIHMMENNKYDYVFLVAGMTFSFEVDMVAQLRELQKTARFVMYQWDSEKNLPYSTRIHCYFDEIYSFDRFDCQKKGIYHFIPLFYTSSYEKIGKLTDVDVKYDCSYVGTAHPKKYWDINKMATALKEKYPQQYIYHYMPSKLKFVFHKVFAKEFRHTKYSEFESTKLSTSQLTKIFMQSKCILDAPQAGQSGLTIRAIECLGAKKKMVTTNTDIRNYDFYNEANILVFEGEINTNSPFFTEEYQELSEEVYSKYALRNWLSRMLN